MPQVSPLSQNTRPQAPAHQPGRRWPLAWYAFVVIALAAVCLLPEHVPVAPTVSDSYTFGFSNRVAFPLLLLLFAAGTLWTRGFGLELVPPTAAAQPPRRSDLAWALGLTAAIGLLMLAATHQLTGFAEAVYLMNRSRLTAAGLRPYRDFEFSYGALLAYGPVWTARLLHLSTNAGYWIFWLLNCLAGCALIFRILQRATYPGRYLRVLFWLCILWSWTAMPSMGINYTYVRFATGPWMALEMQRALFRDGPDAPPRWAAGVAMALLGTVLTLFISPEMGVAFLAGSALWLVTLRCGWTSYRVGALAGFAAVAAAILAVAAHFRYFELMLVMSKGGSNDPYMPSLHLLVFFATVAACAAWLRFRWLNAGTADPISALAMVSVPTLASAMGRCDPAHVWFGGFGLIVAGLLLLSRTRFALVVFGAAFVAYILPTAVHLPFVLAPFAKAVTRSALTANPPKTGPLVRLLQKRAEAQLGKAEAEAKFARQRRFASLGGHPNWPLLYPGVALGPNPQFAAPMGYQPDSFGEYEAPDIHDGRYFGLQNVLAPSQWEAKLAELSAHPERLLLMHQTFPALCQPVDPVAARHRISVMFSFPYWRNAVHTESDAAPLCRYVLDNYVQVAPHSPENLEYSLWKHR